MKPLLSQANLSLNWVMGRRNFYQLQLTPATAAGVSSHIHLALAIISHAAANALQFELVKLLTRRPWKSTAVAASAYLLQ